MKSLWLILCFVLACGWSTTQAAQQVDERRPFSPNGRVEISIVGGSVEVRGWNREELQVTGEIESDRDRLRLDISGDDASISVHEERERRSRHGRKQHGEAHLLVRVPVSTRVAVMTVSGEIDVENIALNQRLESVSGNIETQMRGNEGAFRTVSGEIEVEASGDGRRFAAHSVSGDIELRGVAGELRLETVSGDIDIEAGPFSRLDAHTVSGDLDLKGEFTRGGDIAIESVNGEIRLELQSLYDTEFHLETFNGDISDILDFSPVRQSRYAPGYMLRLTEGDGASRIRIETLNGDIDIIGTGVQQREARVSNSSARARHRDDQEHDHDRDRNRHEEDSDESDEDNERLRRETRDFDEAMRELERELGKPKTDSSLPDDR